MNQSQKIEKYLKDQISESVLLNSSIKQSKTQKITFKDTQNTARTRQRGQNSFKKNKNYHIEKMDEKTRNEKYVSLFERCKHTQKDNDLKMRQIQALQDFLSKNTKFNYNGLHPTQKTLEFENDISLLHLKKTKLLQLYDKLQKQLKYIRLKNSAKLKLKNNFMKPKSVQVESKIFMKNAELIQEADKLKTKLKETENLINEHMKYVNFHNLQIQDPNIRQNQLVRFQKNPHLYKIHLQNQQVLCGKELNMVEERHENLLLDIEKTKQSLQQLKIKVSTEQKKLSDFDIDDLNMYKKKLQRLKLKEVRLKSKMDILFENPFLADQKKIRKEIMQISELQTEYEMKKKTKQRELKVSNALNKEIEKLQSEETRIRENTIKLEKQLQKLKMLKNQQYENNKKQKEFQIEENKDLYQNILALIKEKNNQQVSNTESKIKYSSDIKQQKLNELAHINQQIEIFKNKLKMRKKDLIEVKHPLNQKFNQKKEINNLLYQKYQDDLKILNQIQSLFYPNSKMKKIALDNHNQEFIYTEGHSVFEQDLNNESFCDFQQNDNFLELYLDQYSLKDPHSDVQKGFVFSFMKFEEVCTELRYDQRLDFQQAYQLNFKDIDMSQFLTESIHFTLLAKTNNQIYTLGEGTIPLQQLLFENLYSTNNKQSVIVLDSALIKSNNKTVQKIGCLDFRLRFKYPIQQNITKQLVKKLDKGRFRNLCIQVPQILNLEQKGRYYLSVSYEGKIYISDLVLGNNPLFNYKLKLPIFGELENDPLLIIRIFNDSVSFEQKEKDFIGSISLNLAKLSLNQSIVRKEIFKMKDKFSVNKVSGVIAIYWEDQFKTDYELFKEVYNENWVNQKIQEINKFLENEKFFLQNIKEEYDKEQFMKEVLNFDQDLLDTQKVVKNRLFNNSFEYFCFWKGLFLKQKGNVEQADITSLKLSKESLKNIFFDYYEAQQELQRIEKEIRMSNKEKNQMKEKQENQKLGYLIETFQNKLKEFRAKTQKETFEVLIYFDKNDNGTLSFQEVSQIAQDLGCQFSKQQIKALFQCLDRDGSEEWELIELLKIQEQTSFDIIHNRRNKVLTNKFKDYKKNSIKRKYLKTIKEYIKSNNLTKLQFFQKFSSKSKHFTKDALRQLNQNVLNIKLKNFELNVIYEELDRDKSSSVDFNEFCRFLKLENVFRMVESQSVREEFKSNQFFQRLDEYINEQQISVKQFVLNIDKNGDGKLDHFELFTFFKTLFQKRALDFNQMDFEKFLKIANQDKDELIEVKEIKVLLEAYQKYTQEPQSYPEKFIQQVLLKMKALKDEYFFRLQINFETQEDKPFHVPIKQFKEILSEYSILDKTEIEVIVNPISLPFTKFQRINYKQFLKFEEFYKKEIEYIQRNIAQDESEKRSLKGKAFEIFKMIQQIGKKYEYDKFLIFSMFDKSNQGFVTPKNIFEVFKEIGLDFRYSQIEEAFLEIDTNSDLRVDLSEFCAFLDKL